MGNVVTGRLWQDLQPGVNDLFGDDAWWHLWTPEVLRHISGTPRCAFPSLPARGAGSAELIPVWGPLLPLFFFHLAWPRVDLGLANWARSGFATMEDSTLKAVVKLWGPGLRAFVLWYLDVSPYPLGRKEFRDVVAELKRAPGEPQFQRVFGSHEGGSDELHLGPHFGAAGGHEFQTWVEKEQPWDGYPGETRRVETGHDELILPTYFGWHRILEAHGATLEPLASGRSWRVDVTIVPIGYVGEFRKSRLSGRWFTGKHRAHELGVPAK